MIKTVSVKCLACALGIAMCAGGGLGDPAATAQAEDMMSARFAPVSASSVFDQFGGSAGAELKLAYPQSHKIQFLKGGAARVSIWDGARYLPKVFTAVESRKGSQVCLARTRGWTGGCLTIKSNGRDLRCRYLWNNGASGETACRVTPIRAG